MKLLYQLNAAFTALLVIIMSVTAFFIYSLLLDILIQDEQNQLQDNGEILLNILYEQEYGARGDLLLSKVMRNNDFKVLFFDPDRNQVLYSSLPDSITEAWSSQFEREEQHKALWKTEGENYVISKLRYNYQGKRFLLVLATPLEELQSIQSVFAARMITIFIIGIFIAVLFSYLLTKRLVTPLSHLKREVKKIENRQFESIQPIGASGEIGEVEQSVLEMANELDRYIHSQKHFFQNASHELKTPLMTIQGYAEGVRDGVFEGDAANRSLDVIVKESERLKKIVNEIILLAKLDSEEGIYHPQNMSISSVLKQTKERVLPLAQERNITLDIELEEDKTLYIDDEKMLQAMINIVSNGIRHANEKVILKGFTSEGTYHIQVKDDGNGVPDDLLPQLFHRFVKGKEGETGLGLAISRAIIERSGGTIQVFNEEKSGAVFEIEFSDE
ncbi:HAMP domain-containing protein [Pontibacillus yanchengensis]|uniref:HAMP domain-containing protein n=2 Tax=Pontibacillus yanchengensis TaxID=462910 RepID=A0ACC7VHL4_9BACI|nr:HAMP domain-containing sensor histidine kinase [Pontibacillus yanchengensis]MYL34559.1 HAMP domain-containing protein [Pontibacillus yanchengensis]MYL54426.1 HAMP domain-containing protein [Pontibacillus yanchengensis]